MTAQEFANENDNVVLFLAGNGCPAGRDVALLEDTALSFNLCDVEGEVHDGVFNATNLNDGSGIYGWRFHDWKANILYKIQLYVDADEWQAQHDGAE